MSSSILCKLRKANCEIHRDKQLELFCCDCEAVVCVLCFAAKHNYHKCSDLDKSAEQYERELKKWEIQLQALLANSQDKLKKLDHSKEEFLEQVSLNVEKLIRRCNELKSLIDSQHLQLLEELVKEKNRYLKQIQERKEEINRQLTTINSFIEYYGQLKEKGTSCDISRDGKDLITRAEVISKECKKVYSYEWSFHKITFFLPLHMSMKTQLVGSLDVKDVYPPGPPVKYEGTISIFPFGWTQDQQVEDRGSPSRKRKTPILYF